ncbi:MAG: hypothetical protein QXG39_03290 [Candidatus Aenigmatarchaeota archaeon]
MITDLESSIKRLAKRFEKRFNTHCELEEDEETISVTCSEPHISIDISKSEPYSTTITGSIRPKESFSSKHDVAEIENNSYFSFVSDTYNLKKEAKVGEAKTYYEYLSRIGHRLKENLENAGFSCDEVIVSVEEMSLSCKIEKERPEGLTYYSNPPSISLDAHIALFSDRPSKLLNISGKITNMDESSVLSTLLSAVKPTSYVFDTTVDSYIWFFPRKENIYSLDDDILDMTYKPVSIRQNAKIITALAEEEYPKIEQVPYIEEEE